MSLDLQQYHDQIQALRPMDDVFFELLIQQPYVCQEMLRVLLDCPELTVLDVHAQHSIRKLLRRSVRLDALCQLPDKKLVNIEIQNGNNTDHFKRVRYNEACVTTQTTDPGTDFKNIPTVYSLYVSDFDMFKQGKTIYHTRKSVIETDQTIDDGTFEVYANTVIDDGSTIAEYLQLLKETSINNPKFPHLTDGVKYLKNEERGVEKMSGFLAELLEKEVKKGVQEGIQKKEKEFQEKEKKFQERENQFQERENQFQERENQFQEREKEREKEFQERENQFQKKLQKSHDEIAVSKICKMLELGYSKEDILNLDYTNTEYNLALEKISTKGVTI